MASTFRRKQQPQVAHPAEAGAVRSSVTGTSHNHQAFVGTKPSTGGVTLVSFGLRDVDQIILGGGQPLGTCILLEQSDCWTRRSFVSTLTKYWCAQAIAHEQDLVIPIGSTGDNGLGCVLGSSNGWDSSFLDSNIDDKGANRSDPSNLSIRREIESILQDLPSNLNLARQQQKEQKSASRQDGFESSVGGSALDESLMEALQEEDEDEEDQSAEEGLKIAWQYKKDVQRERLGQTTSNLDSSLISRRMAPTSTSSDSSFCHSFNLQGRLSQQQEIVPGQHYRWLTLSPANDPLEYYTQLEQLLLLRAKDYTKVARVLLYEQDRLLLRFALPLLLGRIRQEKLPIVLLVVCKSWQQPAHAKAHEQALVSLRRTADVVLQAEGFVARPMYPPPAEFAMFQGLLRVPKAAATTAVAGHFADFTTTRRPPSDLFGFKRDRRKLHIQLLHIPPEDYAAGGGSVGGGGVRSGAGRTDKAGSLGCASSGGAAGGGESPLDF